MDADNSNIPNALIKSICNPPYSGSIPKKVPSLCLKCTTAKPYPSAYSDKSIHFVGTRRSGLSFSLKQSPFNNEEVF